MSPPAAMAGGSRHEARERALSLLYEAEAKDLEPAALLRELPVPPEAFVSELVGGVGARHVEIDGLLGRFAVGWAVDRMAVIDRNILRLAVYELLCHGGTPIAVVLSEAVELANTYSTDESGRFVNGVLAAVAGEVRAGA